MDTYAVYLRPRGSLASELGSDTLFGAVCWAIRILGLVDDVEAMLEGFATRPRFAFSSAFPSFEEGEHRVRFYPRPCLPEMSPGQIEVLAQEECNKNPRLERKAAKVQVVQLAKRLDGKLYLSEALFGEVVRGEIDTVGLYRRFKKIGYNPQDIEAAGAVLISHGERRRLYGELLTFMAEADVQHNQVDRVAGATAEGLLFFERETFFRSGGGLWFVLRAEAEDVENLIRPALRYLADTGLGANRASGKGHFDIEIGEKIALPQAEGTNANAFLVLSRYLPKEGEWPADKSPLAYRLLHLWPKRESKFVQPVVGQATAPVYKRRLRVFAPGSIFPLAGEPRSLYGRLAEVVPKPASGHGVWQSGLAVPVLARIVLSDGGA